MNKNIVFIWDYKICDWKFKSICISFILLEVEEVNWVEVVYFDFVFKISFFIFMR